MANSGYDFRELRFIIEDDLTRVYVFLEATGDSPITVQGWHSETFPAKLSIVDILNRHVHDVVTWPLKAPPKGV